MGPVNAQATTSATQIRNVTGFPAHFEVTCANCANHESPVSGLLAAPTSGACFAARDPLFPFFEFAMKAPHPISLRGEKSSITVGPRASKRGDMDLKLLVAALAGTLVHFGIAVIGAGGFAMFFSHPPLIVLTVVTFALAFASMFTGGNLNAGEREDRANRWVIPAFFALGLLSAYFPAYTDRIDFWTFDGDSVRWIGVALFTIGGIVRLWPVFVLGRR